MSEKKILIVEDNEQNLKLFHDLLITKGYKVMSARDGDSALAKIYQEIPDLIIMDIQIPRIDGIEVTRRIRKKFPAEDIAIIAVTAHAMKGDREDLLKAGFDDYMPKPINISTFLQTVEDYLCRVTDNKKTDGR
jgi:two-component system cell cycle response regulator DivK